jgi:hypothetical protein
MQSRNIIKHILIYNFWYCHNLKFYVNHQVALQVVRDIVAAQTSVNTLINLTVKINYSKTCHSIDTILL